MSSPGLAGVHHVKLPVSDVQRSRQWYARVFDFEVTWEFPDDNGVVRGVAGTVPGWGDTLLAFRENLAAASGSRGFDFLGFAIRDREHAETWSAHLDDLGIEHSPVIDASEGWLLVFHDPDGIEIHLYSWSSHGIDQSDRTGYGRRVMSNETTREAR